MGLLKNIYLQLFVTKRLVKVLTSDTEFVYESGLDTLEPSDRAISEKALRQAIGFLLSMYETYQTINKEFQFTSEDEKWISFIFSRTRMTKFGEKTIDGTTIRFNSLIEDLETLGRPWENLSDVERFAAICATCYSIESYEMSPPGGHSLELCLFQFDLLIPRIFNDLKISL